MCIILMFSALPFSLIRASSSQPGQGGDVGPVTKWNTARGISGETLRSSRDGSNPSQSETRMPKSERNPKPEHEQIAHFSDFGIRVSFGFRHSSFGFEEAFLNLP